MKSDVILIVDDDPAVRLLMKHALNDQQFKVFEAESAEQAIELFKQHSPDLTLLDVSMDGMDGFDCCVELQTGVATNVSSLGNLAHKRASLHGVDGALAHDSFR